MTALGAPATLIAELELQMKALASRLEFEQAGKVKGRLSTFAKLSDGANRGIRPIGAFAFVSVQPGPRKGTAKVYAISANAVVEVAGVSNAGEAEPRELMDSLNRGQPATASLPADILLGTVCFHLASAKSAHRFVARRDLTDTALAALIADAAKPRAVVEESGEAIRETRVEL